MKSLLNNGRLIFFLIIAGLAPATSIAQQTFTHADTLRGSNTPQRAWWDATFYDLHTTIHPADSTIKGHNTIYYRITDQPQKMQIDLQKPLQIDSIMQARQPLNYTREGNAFFVEMPAGLKQDSVYHLSVYYHGRPIVAKNPPWQGGFVWTQDSLGHRWVSTAVQGLGASAWWPNKDIPSDEPDSATISITVPDPMVDVSNGRLRKTTPHDNGTTTYQWHVSNPINKYGISINAGRYVNFKDTYEGKKGPLDLSFWALKQHEDLAKKQFKQVKPMLKCFEHWFGPYPFYKDSYKLVEAPYLGMEHQSAVTYGNGFQNGYHGTDLSGTGWGMKWDFIIIHESAHEWWANSISAKDMADMWIHESFANYAEALYTECQYGTKAGKAYTRGTRKRILNDKPIIAPYDVNAEGSGDMYYKGGNMLLTIREIIDDASFRHILQGLQKSFYHQTVTTQQVEDYINHQVDYDLSPVFDQYLRTTKVPTLKYYISEDDTLHYRWATTVSGFDMPVDVRVDDHQFERIQPSVNQWKKISISYSDSSTFRVDPNYYIKTQALAESPKTK